MNVSGVLLSGGIALAVLSGSGPAQAENLAGAIAKAYAYHPTLAASRATLRSSQEVVAQQRANGLPQVTGNASYGLTSTDGSALGRGGGRDQTDPLAIGVTGTLTLYSGGRVENSVESAKQNVQSARSNLVQVEQTVILDAVTAYMNVRRDTQFVSLARNNVRVISEQLRAAQDRFDVGEVTRTDVSQAEARLASARSTLAANTGALAQSRQQYVAATGEPPAKLDRPPPTPDLPKNMDEALSLADAQHPSLIAARYAARAAEYDVKTAVGATLPTVSLNTSAAYNNNLFNDGGESNTLSATVQATVPLWTSGGNPSRVRQAQAVLSQRQADVHNTARLIRQTAANAWSTLDVARASIRASRQQIRAAELAYEGVQEEAKLGARTTLDVLDAEQELLNARSGLVSAQRDEVVASYSLLASLGMLTIDHLGVNVADPYDPGAYEGRIESDPNNYDRDDVTDWSTRWRP